MAAPIYNKASHIKERRRINQLMLEGHPITCWACGVALQAGPNWHLDHLPGTNQYRGPACVRCNTSDGGKRTPHTRRRPRPSQTTQTVASRNW